MQWPAREINDRTPVSGHCLLTETPGTRIQRDVIGVLPEFARKFFVCFQSRFSALLSMIILNANQRMKTGEAWEWGYEKLSADFVPTELTYMYYWVVRHHYTTVLQYLLVWHHSVRIYGIYKHLMCFALEFYEALLWLLNTINKLFHLEAFEFIMIVCSLWTPQFYAFILYRPCIFPLPSFPTSLLSYYF